MATYYWRNLTADEWNATNTSNWSLTSGGAGGAGPPTSTDDVVFDANSEIVTFGYGVTIGTNAVAQDITIAGPLAGTLIFTFTSVSVLDCYGSWLNAATFVAFSTTANAKINFVASSTGKTVTTNNVTLGAMAVTFSNSSGGWTLGSAITTTGVFTVTSGTFNTSASNYAINAASYSSAGGAFKSITLNSSTVTCTATGGFQIATTATNLTFSGASSTIVCSNGSPTFGGISGLTYGTVQLTSATLATITITGANTYTDLTFTSRTTDGLGAIGFSGDQVVTGTLTVGTANTAVRRLWLRSSALGTQRTFTVATIATLADVDLRDIVAAGASGTWSGTRLGNCRNNSNITFGAGVTKYWNLAAGGNWNAVAWATSSGGAPASNNFPLAQDTCIIENTGLTAGNTISITVNWNIGTLNLSGRTLAFNWTQGNLDPLFYGDVTLTTAMTMTTVTGSPTWTFCGQGAIQTLNSAGLIIRLSQLFVDSPGWGLTLAVNTEVDLSPIALPFNNGTFILTAGTLDFANKNLSAVVFSMGAGANTLVFGSTGTLTATSTASATVFTGSTTTTVSGTPLVILNANTAATRTISPGIVTEENSISFNITAGTGTVTLTTNHSFKNVNYTGFTGIWGTSSPVIYGNLTLNPSPMSVTAGGTVFFQSTSGTKTITTNAVVVDKSFTFNGVGGTWQLQDALTSGATRTTTLTNGTLDLNDYTLTTGIFSSSNANLRALSFGTLGGGGSIELTSASTTANVTIFDTSNSTNFTADRNGDVNVVGAPTAFIRTIAPGLVSSGGTINNTFVFNILDGSDTINLGTANHVYYDILINGFSGSIAANAAPYIYGGFNNQTAAITGGTNAWVFAGTSFFNSIITPASDINNPVTFDGVGGGWELYNGFIINGAVTFINGTLKIQNGTTLTVGSFATSGTNQKFLRSTSPGSQATISAASGTNSVSYLTIQDSNATGGATFYAIDPTNVNAGNNTGWIFRNPTGGSGGGTRFGFGFRI